MKKIRITKKRDKALHVALSMDDYLYAKFRAQQDELKKMHEQYIRKPQSYWEVLRQLPGGNFVKEMVVSCEVADCGTRIIIK